MNYDELIELWAELSHRQWSGWARWMIDTYDDASIARWEQQIKTPYAELSEKEKESDRVEARKELEVLHQYMEKNRVAFFDVASLDQIPREDE